ncbi:hypothetical protein HNP38_000286 [Chryseobacterium defluvii]|uniref:Uncharacterized protein n=1 Tax=Chryseobacterium defluvii TaxID=160396 RepID=A0A840KB18_9FLAO|nr:hypothetical protein [Chryseobacterium defluvii]MBB4805014.1 hypothetical protein [Chryseobacterium defluvii]
MENKWKKIWNKWWTAILFFIAIGISQIMDPAINWIPLAINLLIVVLYFYVFKFHKKQQHNN